MILHGANQKSKPASRSFLTKRGDTEVLIFNLVVTDFSDHRPRGYELGLKGYALYANGKLTEKIPPG